MAIAGGEKMTCKDCLYYEMCIDTCADENWNDEAPKEIKEMFSPKGCEHFKNKADFAEVVRCFECNIPHNKWTGCPYMNGLIPPPNHFCSYGVKKDKE